MTKGGKLLQSTVVITSESPTILSDMIFRTPYSWQNQKAAVSYGYALGPGNQKISIVLEYNLDPNGILTLSSFVDGTRTELATLNIVNP